MKLCTEQDHDLMIIYSGTTSESETLEVLSGCEQAAARRATQTITTNAYDILISFVSDESTTNIGISITVEFGKFVSCVKLSHTWIYNKYT